MPNAVNCGWSWEIDPGRVDVRTVVSLMFTCASGLSPASWSPTVFIPGRLIPDARPLPPGSAALPFHAICGA